MTTKKISPKVYSAQGVDNFEFDLVGPLDNKPFLGYASSPDKTAISPQFMILGSKNVYKKVSGTLAWRPGLKLRGVVEATLAKVDSSFEWNTWNGRCLPLRISNGKLQVESDIVSSGSPIWYTLLSGLTKTRYVFDAWWDNTNKKDVLLFVNGSADLGRWSGAMALIASAANTAGVVQTNAVINAAGSSYVAGDVLTITGGGGTGATVTVTTVSGGGGVTAFTLTTPGSGYSTGTGRATSGGSGTGATIDITAVTGVITLDRNALIAGFTATSSSVIINGTTYTYGGAIGIYLIGIGSDPSGEAVNSAAIEITGSTGSFTPAGSSYAADFCRVINNALWVGSYTSRVFYKSKISSYTDFSQGTPRIPGDGETITADDVGRGIGVRQGNAWLSAGTSNWYEISFSQITVGSTLSEQTKVDKKPVAVLQAALAHEFIDMIGDTLVCLCQDQQVRQIGLFTDQFETKYPSLSLAIQEELKSVNFSTGHLRAIGGIIYITAPTSGVDYMLEKREAINALGQIMTEWFWHAPQVRNMSRFAVIAGVVFGHSNAFPQLYQVWDTSQWHDDSPNATTSGVAYDVVLRLAYTQAGRRQGKNSFDKVYVEGYITPGTPLMGNVYLDYQGATGTSNLDLNSAGDIPVFVGAGAPSLGDGSNGDNPLGDGITINATDQEQLPKFRIIKGVALTDNFEYALELSTSALDARAELLAIGTNATMSDANPIEIMR